MLRPSYQRSLLNPFLRVCHGCQSFGSQRKSKLYKTLLVRQYRHLHPPMPFRLTCAIVVLLLGLCLVVVAVWRLFFHPLRSIPGPRLAAVTSLYRIYYEVILGGEFLSKVIQLHDTYGAQPLTPNLVLKLTFTQAPSYVSLQTK